MKKLVVLLLGAILAIIILASCTPEEECMYFGVSCEFISPISPIELAPAVVPAAPVQMETVCDWMGCRYEFSR